MSSGPHDPAADVAPGTTSSEYLTALVSRLAGDHAALSGRVTELEDLYEDLAGTFDAIEDLDAELRDSTPEGLLWPDAVSPDAAALPSSPLAPVHEPAPDAQDAQDAGEQPEVGLDMRRLVAWVRDNVALLFERKLPQTGGQPYWCRSWWMHPEAIARLEAARRSWAEAVVAGDGNAMVVYFEHLDHQLAVLCGENGPFCACAGGAHNATSSVRALGHIDPDESYFLDFERATEPTPASW